MAGRRLRENLWLLSLVVLLGAVAWWRPGREVERLAPLTTVSPEAVARIGIGRPDGVEMRFERRGGRWFMVHPYALPANQVRLRALARVAEAPVLQSFPLPTGGVAQYGLDRPIRLTLDDRSLLFGGVDPIGNHRYLRRGDRLILIVDRFYHHLSAAPEQLLSLDLLPEGGRVVTIVEGHRRLERRDGRWRVVPDRGGLGGDDLVERVRLWRRAQALRLAPMRVADGRRVEIHLEDGRRLSFVGARVGGRFWFVRPDLGLGYQMPSASPLTRPLAGEE